MIPENNYLRIAKIKCAHSLDGKLKIHVITDIVERFDAGNSVYLKAGDSYKKCTVRAFSMMKKRTALLKLEGINDRTEAEKYDGVEVFIDRDAAESIRPVLDNDTFFYRDIIGCRVIYKGDEFGTVTDIFEGGSGDILIIEDKSGKNVMMPFVESMVDTGDISRGYIEITPVEGLLDS